MANARIFGIDPGTNVVGYGVIDLEDGDMSLIAAGAIRAGSRGSAIAERLARIHGELSLLIAKHRPSIVVLEQAFYGKSIQAAIRLGEGRGVALLAASQAGIDVAEYSPAIVKKAVVGFGTADKSQVGSMVQALLRLPAPLQPADASDALALAICHGHRFPLASRAAEE